MKTKYIWPLLMGLSLTACSEKEGRGVNITANIEGLEAGELIFYTPASDTDNTQMQSVPSEAGKFSMHVPVEAGKGEWYTISIGASAIPDNVIEVYLDSGVLKLTGKDAGFKGVKYEGTAFAKEYNEFTASLTESLVGAKLWVNGHPESAFGTALIEYFLKRNILQKDTVMAMVGLRSPSAMNNLPAKRLLKWMEETDNVRIGKVAPDFSMADTLGKQVVLSSFKGKYVLVDFWASWCGPCRADNPHVLKAFNQFKEKGFTVVGVSLDKQSDSLKWIGAIHTDQLQWTQLSDLKGFENAAAQLYHVNSIPSNFLLDPNGVIIAKDLRGELIAQKLAEILGN